MYSVIAMLGVNLNLKEAVAGALTSAKEEALGRIPGYNAIANEVRRYQAKQKLKGPKSGSNTVDEYEFKKALRHIDAEISGTWNPFRWIWGFVQSFLGNSKQERVATTIKALEDYGHQHDGYKFVNEAQRILITKIEHRISAIDGWFSKILGTKNSKVAHDPILTALKSAATAWLEPFDKIINGEVAEVPKPSEADMNFLIEMRDRIQYSPKARYIEDMLPKYDQLILEGKRVMLNNATVPHQPRIPSRKLGQNLAKTAA